MAVGENLEEETKGMRLAMDVELSVEELRRQIVDQVADKLVEATDEKLDAAIERRVKTVVDKAVMERATVLLNEGFKIPGDDGSPEARIVTLHDLMREQSTGYMEETVDSEGKSARDSGFGYRRERMTRAQWLSRGAARKVWDYDLKQVVDKAVAGIHDEVMKQVNLEMATKLRKVLGV